MKTLKKVLVITSILLIIFVVKAFVKTAVKSSVDDSNQVENYDGAIEKKMSDTFQQMNSELPMMIDNETRLDLTTNVGKQAYYQYTLVNLLYGDFDHTTLYNKAKENVTEACSDRNMIISLKAGVQYNFIYRDKDGTQIFIVQLNKDTCDL